VDLVILRQLILNRQVTAADLTEAFKNTGAQHKSSILSELLTAGPDAVNQIPRSSLYTWASKSKGTSSDASSAYAQLINLEIDVLLGFMTTANTPLVERKSGSGKKRYSLAVSKVNTIAGIKKLSELDLLALFQIGSANPNQAGNSSVLVNLLSTTTAADSKATGYSNNGITPDTSKDETFDNVYTAWLDSRRPDDFSFSDIQTPYDVYHFLSQGGSNSTVNADPVAIDESTGLNAPSSNSNSNKLFNQLCANLASAAGVAKATNNIGTLYAGVVAFAKKQLDYGKTNTSHKDVDDAVATLLGSITLSANDPDSTSPDTKIMSNYLASLPIEQKNKLKFNSIFLSIVKL